MLQYKEIAQVNEVALKQIEFAHEKFKAEVHPCIFNLICLKVAIPIFSVFFFFVFLSFEMCTKACLFDCVYKCYFIQADKLKKSLEDEIHFFQGRVSKLESDLVSKSTEVTFAVSGKEEALSSAFAEIDRLKEENSVKT
ncbi:nuclear-pore anchor-like isoform X1 [Magnolia sinica]|uniref:nuclear-pore anchor-like isoform X1 n=1 Tax=Magnolia sinica TaxID=86752 RepID=UPI00265B271B|nr:nuclear-pore anchor-like isoform X1 [Magnolia sinica]